MNHITLRSIDKSNFLDAFRLELAEEQEAFVSHPIRSLAQAYVYYHQCTPFGIYAGEAMVGYVMVIYDQDTGEYNLWHLMIDKIISTEVMENKLFWPVWNTFVKSLLDPELLCY